MDYGHHHCCIDWLALIGGVRSIGQVAGIMVPIMAILYISGGLIILSIHFDRIPEALSLIVSSAFSGQAAAGGFAGSTIMMGIANGRGSQCFF